jgi:ADP-heptose:LPS heptosyltransferase
VGNDTGLSHLSVTLRVTSIVIYGDCHAQIYSSYIKAIVIDEKEQRSRYSINQINFEKVKKVIDNYI